MRFRLTSRKIVAKFASLKEFLVIFEFEEKNNLFGYLMNCDGTYE